MITIVTIVIAVTLCLGGIIPVLYSIWYTRTFPLNQSQTYKIMINTSITEDLKRTNRVLMMFIISGIIIASLHLLIIGYYLVIRFLPITNPVLHDLPVVTTGSLSILGIPLCGLMLIVAMTQSASKKLNFLQGVFSV